MAEHSAIYEGWVRHRRFANRSHEFRYPLAMTCFDLDELPTLFRGRMAWGYERSALIAFHRADYFGDRRQPLKEAVGDLVESRLGRRPTGSVRLLTNLRHLGYSFNPLSVYYCLDGEDRLDAVVLEVRNTPWAQRHCYVLDGRSDSTDGTLRLEQPKAFHVSPFLGMDLAYRFAITPPAERLLVHIDCVSPQGTALDATLSLVRRPWNRSTSTRLLLRYPWMTGRVIAAIYWQALKLWRKGVPYQQPPDTTPNASPPTDSSPVRVSVKAAAARDDR